MQLSHEPPTEEKDRFLFMSNLNEAQNEIQFDSSKITVLEMIHLAREKARATGQDVFFFSHEQRIEVGAESEVSYLHDLSILANRGIINKSVLNSQVRLEPDEKSKAKEVFGKPEFLIPSWNELCSV